jgi:hypothetical protein
MSARDTYNIARRLIFDAWYMQFLKANNGNEQKATELTNQWVNERKFSQNEIRLEVELNNASNLFTFGVTTVQNNSNNFLFPTEKRLNQSDTLVASEYKIYVGAPSNRADTTYKLRTYGNIVDFTAAQALAIDGEFYGNGQYSVKVNNDTIIPLRGLFNHLYRPQTQQTAALGVGSPNDQFRGAEDGAITQEPNLLLIGSKTYVPQITLNTALVPAMAFTRAILIYAGVLAQNATVIN